MSGDYKSRKAYFDGLLTLFGRNPVREALLAPEVDPVTLHLASSNRPSRELDDLVALAESRSAEIRQHTREALSRISKNRKQDQGVAIDVRASTYQRAEAITREMGLDGLIAVDGITNPQNLGMIIRAVGASPRAGLILARSGNARVDGLVIKASAGTLFRTPIYHCDQLPPVLATLKGQGFSVYGLDGEGRVTLDEVSSTEPRVFVLGNETSGLSPAVREHCDGLVAIPMRRGIESLNVAVAAGIVAFTR